MTAGDGGDGSDAGTGPRDDDPNAPPQLHIFEGPTRESELGTLVSGDERWGLHVSLERTSTDLFRGRISFRRENERHDTGAILLGETEEAVVERASELPASVLRQLLDSLRG